MSTRLALTASQLPQRVTRGALPLREWIVRTCAACAVLVTWHLGAGSDGATPGRVLASLADAIRDGGLGGALAVSLGRVALGYAVALLLGTLLGLAMARVRVLDDLLGSPLLSLQSLPSICWFPMALLWFGPNEVAVQFVVITGALFAVALSIRAGVRTLPPSYIHAGRMLGARGYRLWVSVLLPASLPTFVNGMRQGWAFAWRALMAAEMLAPALTTGIGKLLNEGRSAAAAGDGGAARLLATILVILVVGLAVDRALFGPLDAWIARRWGVAR